MRRPLLLFGLLLIALIVLHATYAQDSSAQDSSTQNVSTQGFNIGTAVVGTMQEAEQRLASGWDNALLAYLTQENRLVMIQGELGVDEQETEALQETYAPRLQQARDDQARMTILQEAAKGLTDRIHGTFSPLSSTSARQPAPLCGLLKDGTCEAMCPQPDLDCQCGDNRCESYENRDTCPADCRPPRNYLCTIARDNFCDKGCPGFDIDCEVFSLVDTTMGYYQRDENLYARAMAGLSILMVLLLGVGMWLLHDIYNIRFGKS